MYVWYVWYVCMVELTAASDCFSLDLLLFASSASFNFNCRDDIWIFLNSLLMYTYRLSYACVCKYVCAYVCM